MKKVIVTEEYDSKINEHLYEEGQMIKVTELDGFEDSYAIYRYGGLDWIPKTHVKIVD